MISLTASGISAIRELAIALAFGATTQTDALILGLTPLLLLVSLVSLGNAANAVVPIVRRATSVAEASGSSLMAAIVLGFGLSVATAAMGSAILPQLDPSINGSEFGLAASVNLLVSPGVAAIVIGAVAAAIANAHSEFIVASLAQLALAALTAIGAVIAYLTSTGPLSIAAAFLVGALGFMIVALASMRRAGARVSIAECTPQGIGKAVARLSKVAAIPLLGHPAIIVERIVAISLGPGILTAAYFGRRAASTVAAATGGAWGTLLLPELSDGDHHRDFPRAVLRSVVIRASTAALVVCAAVLVIQPPIENWGLLRRGVLAFAGTIPFAAVFAVLSKIPFVDRSLRSAVVTYATVGGVGVIALLLVWLVTGGLVGIAAAYAISLSTGMLMIAVTRSRAVS